jgi:hypothetical protein
VYLAGVVVSRFYDLLVASPFSMAPKDDVLRVLFSTIPFHCGYLSPKKRILTINDL